jgi:hypothetical protein
MLTSGIAQAIVITDSMRGDLCRFNGTKMSTRLSRRRKINNATCCLISVPHRCEGDVLGWMPRCFPMNAYPVTSISILFR